jgi:hypothetical protein
LSCVSLCVTCADRSCAIESRVFSPIDCGSLAIVPKRYVAFFLPAKLLRSTF